MIAQRKRYKTIFKIMIAQRKKKGKGSCRHYNMLFKVMLNLFSIKINNNDNTEDIITLYLHRTKVEYLMHVDSVECIILKKKY